MSFKEILVTLVLLGILFFIGVTLQDERNYLYGPAFTEVPEQSSVDSEGPSEVGGSEEVFTVDVDSEVTLYLKNGKTARGLFLRVAGEALFLEVDGKEVSFKRKDIDHVAELQSEEEKEDPNDVTLYLQSGGAISGKLLRFNAREFVLWWQGGEVAFAKEEVVRLERGRRIQSEAGVLVAEREDEGEWPYSHDMALILKNGSAIDGKVVGVAAKRVTVETQLEGGGTIEQDISRNTIQHIKFKTLRNRETRKVVKSLGRQFEGMHFYTDGNITVFTDSYVTWVKKYQSILNEIYTELYFTFFPLFKDRAPHIQTFVVIFDDYADYLEYAATDGVPGLFVAGYFMPSHKVLFLPNQLGDTMSDYLKTIFVDLFGDIIDQQAALLTKAAGESYRLSIEGMSEDTKKRFWQYHDMVAYELRQSTYQILRHEVTHSILHNWGLQSIIVESPDIDPEALSEQKREFLDAKSKEEKRKILEYLLELRGTKEEYDFEAANSWFVEGIATYSETVPFGSENGDYLYHFQQARKENTLMPLEHLTVYKIGSFPGVYPEAMLTAYSESWAFVTFLMNRYREPFLSYLERMATEKSEGGKDLEWLTEAIGKDIRVIENEFLHYMDKYFPAVEDPYFTKWQKLKKIFTAY